MSGWDRYVVGNADILKTLGKTKSYLDFGYFRAVQELPPPLWKVRRLRRHMSSSIRNAARFVDGLNEIGWKTEKPKATFYVWTKIPPNIPRSPPQFATLLVDEIGVAVAPGTGFGNMAKVLRFALVENSTGSNWLKK